jgi:phytoene dehydrogenase-like protein
MSTSTPLPPATDVVIVGGGHNGLTAAAYLAKAGVRAVVLEKSDHFGGAAVSAEAFVGVEARLSRYSYLVSLMPRAIVDDLSLPIELIRRRYSSYTPVPGGTTGLLVDTHDAERTRESFRSIGAEADYERFVDFYGECEIVAEAIFPTMLSPLLTREEVRHLVEAAAPGRGLYEKFFTRRIEEVVEESFQSDLVKGVVLTDSLIGTFPQSDDDFSTTICFLYHVIGGGTGDWDVPVGGMGAVSSSLEFAARAAGATLVSGCAVDSIDSGRVVRGLHAGMPFEIEATVLISAVAPAALRQLTGGAQGESVEGAQVKVNLLLERLPRLIDKAVTPEEAFGGTFHINELSSQLASSIAAARKGNIPPTIPCEIYCHSLSDPSILGPELHESGAQTLTVFALNVPHGVIRNSDPDAVRADLQERVLASLNSVLAEPIESCVLEDGNGELCIETKTTIDLEQALGLPGGNIFHEPLTWPFAEDDEPLDSPATRWGVDSGIEGIVCAGSGARRGGGVSGIGGHNAAMATLEILGLG